MIEQGLAWTTDNTNCQYRLDAGGTLTSWTGNDKDGPSKANLTVSGGIAKGKMTWKPELTGGEDWDIEFSVKPTAKGPEERPVRMY